MQIVIEISEQDYELACKYPEILFGSYGRAIAKGTPLDKIRAEIMELDYDIETIDFDLNDIPQTEMVHTICREEVLRIIDKHKAESEDKE